MNKRMFGSVLGASLIAVSTFVMGTSGQVAAADSNCQQVHGYLQTQVVAPDQTQGTITQGGQLNGTTQDQIVFNPSTGTSTATYTATFQDTTESGTIVLRDNGVFFSNGDFAEYGTIDGKASTGAFAGATGLLTFIGSTSDGIHFTATVNGKVCKTDH